MYSVVKSSVFKIVIAAWLVLSMGSGQASPADNKHAAIEAMTDLFKRQDPTGVDRYFASPYRQHNMHAPDELDALRALAREATRWPGVSTTIHRGLADGELVALHSVYWNLLNLHTQNVAFDVFRFKDGKIVEHWDALEPLAETAGPNQFPNQFNGAMNIEDLGKTEDNRRVARDYVQTVLAAGKSAQASRFIGPQYVEHAARPRRVFDATKPDLSAPMPETVSRYVKVHRTVAEGNFVLVQSEGRMAGEILVIYDLYRLHNGKIVEHWDVRQPVAPRAQWANPNGPF